MGWRETEKIRSEDKIGICAFPKNLILCLKAIDLEFPLFLKKIPGDSR